MNKISFNLVQSEFSNALNACNENSNCNNSYNETICTDTFKSYDTNPKIKLYNDKINYIKSHFLYIIALNTETKYNFKDRINKEKINKRYVDYDSIDINYQNTWIKRFTFWIYFIAILLYISVFILKNLYRKKIEYFYLIMIILAPFLSKKGLEFINMFYKYNILFTNNKN